MTPYRHLLRAGILLGAALLVFFIIRTLAVPSSYGQYGHFRGDNLAEQVAIPMQYGPPQVCEGCHSDKVVQKEKGKHKSIPCQTCHGPVSAHIQDSGVQPMGVNRSWTLCARCHQKIEGRPRSFPQIIIQDHLSTLGVTVDGNEAACLTCHNPHSPK